MLEYHCRPWQRAEDTSAIYALAARLPDEAIAAAALPYQLSSWATDDPNNLALWTTPDGDLMAFAFFQVPFATLHYAIHPRAKVASGFHGAALLAGVGEVDAATTLLCEAFAIDSVTLPWRRRILEQPAYRPELDIVIAAPNGRLAAFCLLWLHPHGHTGQIEPMATHPDFQRLGLGSASIYAGLAQIAALGATRAVVGTSGSNHRSQGMYQGTGFRLQYRRVGYQYKVESL